MDACSSSGRRSGARTRTASACGSRSSASTGSRGRFRSSGTPGTGWRPRRGSAPSRRSSTATPSCTARTRSSRTSTSATTSRRTPAGTARRCAPSGRTGSSWSRQDATSWTRIGPAVLAVTRCRRRRRVVCGRVTVEAGSLLPGQVPRQPRRAGGRGSARRRGRAGRPHGAPAAARGRRRGNARRPLPGGIRAPDGPCHRAARSAGRRGVGHARRHRGGRDGPRERPRPRPGAERPAARDDVRDRRADPRRAGRRASGRVLVAVGGSATVDGGLGALEALDFDLRGAEVVVACDVTTAFVDAAPVFGPQKGADAAAVAELQRRLTELADRYRTDHGVDVRELPGSGAAGGLAGGLAALGARLVPGAELVADVVGLRAALSGASLVLTGEGRFDATSLAGKVVGHVLREGRAARRARRNRRGRRGPCAPPRGRALPHARSSSPARSTSPCATRHASRPTPRRCSRADRTSRRRSTPAPCSENRTVVRVRRRDAHRRHRPTQETHTHASAHRHRKRHTHRSLPRRPLLSRGTPATTRRAAPGTSPSTSGPPRSPFPRPSTTSSRPSTTRAPSASGSPSRAPVTAPGTISSTAPF